MPPTAASEPPRIILVAPAPCEASAFAVAAASSAAPGPGWRVEVRVAREGGRLRARGVIVEPDERVVAERTFWSAGGTCDPLARAIGVWIGVRLDAERDARGTDEPPTRAAAVSADLDVTVRAADPGGVTGRTADPAVRAWQDPDADGSPAARDPWRSVEVGAATVLVAGGGTGVRGALLGGALFAILPVSELLSLRPSFGFARPANEATDLTLISGRVDGCSTFRGRYGARLGLEVALCAGVEAGGISGVRSGPLLAMGSGVAIRGDLGGPLVTELRADAFAAALRPDAVESPFGGRIAVGIAWRVP